MCLLLFRRAPQIIARLLSCFLGVSILLAGTMILSMLTSQGKARAWMLLQVWMEQEHEHGHVPQEQEQEQEHWHGHQQDCWF
jgi:hypothetical protein